MPCASSSAAVIWVTDDLPLVPTTWIDAKRCWGIPSSETQPADPLQPEPPADRLERGEVGLGI